MCLLAVLRVARQVNVLLDLNAGTLTFSNLALTVICSLDRLMYASNLALTVVSGLDCLLCASNLVLTVLYGR